MRLDFFHIKRKTVNFLTEVGRISHFGWRAIKELFKRPFDHKEFIKQSFLVGNKSLMLIGVTGFIMGLVLTIQSRPILVKFGAQATLPGMISVSLLREIGPVLTALLCAGKVGSSIAAEIGAMKVTEQLDAMEVSATKPMSFVVGSRILACTFMLPIMVFISDVLGLIGSYVAVNLYEYNSFIFYMNTAISYLGFIDIIPATIKTYFFGLSIGVISAYHGYNAGMGTEAVGRAANIAVVSASLTIFILDLIAVLVANIFMY